MCVYMDNLRVLLFKKCKLEFDNDDEWKMALMFGVPKKEGVNTDMVNIVLCLSRRSLFLRRNVAFYEGRYLDVWVLFCCQLKAHFHLFFVKGVDFFVDAFMGGNDLFSIEGGELLFTLI